MLAVVAAGVLVLVPAGGATAVERPSAELSKAEAGAGGSVTVTGRGWRPDSLLTLLICGQNMIGGTNSCANADGRAATTDSEGAFSRRLPVAEPPKPCPCVVHVATVTGEAASADAALKVAGHPVAPLPKEEGTGRLAVLAARLDGASGLLTWFGAPPQRQLVLTVGNLGSAPARNPVFQVGTSHGVFAPRWEEQQWRGTLPPGEKVQVKLGVELSAGAHGDYRVALRYGDKVLTEQPWGVGRPWGVTLFWILLFLVVPAAIFRIGMAIVDRIGPWGRTGARTGGPMDGGGASRTGGPMGEGGASRTGLGSRTGPRAPRRTSSRAPTRTGSRLRRRAAEQDALTEALPPQAPQEPGLPWFTPDTLPARQEPAAHAQFSAPSEDRSP
ncbi:hypothetical protein ACH429_23335 [Streptomyces pathocidini]|uniref:Neocarzinostatin family protein n=1 Tax=Streptomyces pathocidini TaxID=1650571 RepID=A0ABW7UZ77_9ACTN